MYLIRHRAENERLIVVVKNISDVNNYIKSWLENVWELIEKYGKTKKGLIEEIMNGGVMIVDERGDWVTDFDVIPYQFGEEFETDEYVPTVKIERTTAERIVNSIYNKEE